MAAISTETKGSPLVKIPREGWRLVVSRPGYGALQNRRSCLHACFGVVVVSFGESGCEETVLLG